MRKVRFILLALVVLAVAQPTFACLYCDWDGRCKFTTQTVPKCRFLESGGCYEGQNLCLGGGGLSDIGSEYEIASVEVQSGDDVPVNVTVETQQTQVARLDADNHKH